MYVRTRLFALVLSMCAVGVVMRPAHAQVLYGSIVGTVEDQTGALVPNAAVTATNKQTGLNLTATSDDGGRYVISNVLPGQYDVKIAASGFRTVSRTDVDVTANTVSRTDFRLEVGATGETITVQGSAVQLQTDKSDTHTEISTKPITSLPLSTYRNYQQLIDLVPGATPAGTQNSATDTPGRSLTTNINGTARNSNNTRLDGAQNVNIWLPHHTAYVAPSETIEVVNVTTGSADAEQGMAGGAAITVVTKSGTNDLHGSVFEYHNNQRMKARNFFLPSNRENPRDTLNIYGGTLGGKIIRNKLFYFGAYEGTHQRTGNQNFFTVPTAAVRSGNFSGFSTIIYDPATGNQNGTGRTPFPGNIIPDDRISPIARRILALVPQPNSSGETANYFSAATGKLDRDNYDIKINYNRNQKHMIWGKYSVMNANVEGVGALGELIGPAVVNDPGLGHTFVQVPTIGHTYTFSPNFLLDQNLGFTRMAQVVKGTDYGKNYGSDVFGIPGTNGPDIRQSGLPIFDFNTYSSYGQTAGWMPTFRYDQSYTHSTNLSWNRGAHELRFGFDLVRHQLNHWQPETGGGPRGQFVFGGGPTALNGGASPNQFNSYAAFLLGLPTTFNKSLQYLTMSGREWQLAYYVRDRWQATRNLTVNIGLRLEDYPLMTRASSGLERLDLDTFKVYLGGRGNVPQNAGISTNRFNWAPRLGLAYRLGEKTVVRSGYGLSPDPIPFSRPLRGWYPYTINRAFAGVNGFDPAGSLAQGIPFFTGPDVSSGVIDLPAGVDERSPGSYIHRGYIQSWNFTVERRLPGDIVTSVAYVGTQTTHQLADRYINAAGPGTPNTARPYADRIGGAIDLKYWDGYLSSNYHSLQVAINRQFSKGLLLKGAYTWSKAINMTDDDGWANVIWNWGPVFNRNRAPAGYDRTHVFQMAYVYELPVGKGKKYIGSGPLSYILGNWQTNGLLSAYTGRPFNVTADAASMQAPGNTTQMADQVKLNIDKPGNVGPGQFYYDPTAFAPVTTARFGTMGRNVLRGPGVFNLDASIFRIFPLTERFRLEFRGEAFNVTNTPKFANPASNVSGGNFMVITSTVSTNTANVYSERQFRVGAVIRF